MHRLSNLAECRQSWLYVTGPGVQIHRLSPSQPVADPEFHNGGGRSREGSEEVAVPPPQKKIEFLPENGGFWCILGLLFTFMQKLVRPMGGQPPPGSATVLNRKLRDVPCHPGSDALASTPRPIFTCGVACRP